MSNTPYIRPPNAMISVRQVCELLTLSHTQLYRLIEAGDFPRQVRIGARRVAFHRHEVDEWIASRERTASATIRGSKGARS